MLEINELKVGDIVELEIIDLDDKANGVAKKDGLIFFVKNTKLGEKVNAKIEKIKKSFCMGTKVETLVVSPFLNNESISENSLCGIYDLSGIVYDKQVEFKKNLIINNINRIASEDISEINFVKAIDKYGYRNKIELKVSPKGYLSFFSRSSNENVKITDCIMITKEINKTLSTLQDLILKHSLDGYDTKKSIGLIKNIIIRSSSIGEVQAVMVVNKEHDFKDFYTDLEKSKIFDSFYVSFNNKRRNYKILDLTHVFGKLKIRENLGDFKFNISPKAFFQINKDISYKIYNKAKEIINKIKPDKIIDLYSGISTTSIMLSDIAKEIVSVEISEDAINDAKENALINGVENITWLNKASEDAIEEIDLEEENTVALFDPPRRGLEENIIIKIGESNISHIVYISCNPSTLARDIKRFKEYGFKIKEITGFDQFVNTIEVESLVHLYR